MASNLTVDSISKGSTTVNTDEIVDTSSNQICKAWVNFNGTGTVAIRDSYNVSSVQDMATGKYKVNYTNAMPNTNYSVAISHGTTTYQNMNSQLGNALTAPYVGQDAVRLLITGTGSSTNYDTEYLMVQVFSN